MFFLWATLLSCDTDTGNPIYDETLGLTESNMSPPDVWVCHHPGTEFHGRTCIEEEFPDGCYVSGDNSKFCWLLKPEDCYESIDTRWMAESCKLFNTRE